MKKKVLILGVGNAQLDAIELCKRRGLEVHGVSYRREGAGLDQLDRFELVNIVDREKVLEYARRIGADAVYSVGSDLAMPTVGFVSKKLGLPFFVEEETADLLQNKGLLREFLLERELSPIPFRVVGSLGELAGWDVFPAILKPVDSQGQRGISEINHASEFEKALSGALSHSRCEKAIIEQFVKGPEISLNAFLWKGNMVYSFITNRYVVEDLPGGIVRGHRLPADVPEWVGERAASLARDIVRSLEIRNGPVYFQMKYTDKDVFVIEVTPRLDGCHIWRLIDLEYGVNLLDLSFRLLLEPGIEPDFPPPREDTIGPLQLDFFLQETHSRFEQKVGKTPTDLYLRWYYSPGEEVRPINCYLEKTGYRIQPAAGEKK